MLTIVEGPDGGGKTTWGNWYRQAVTQWDDPARGAVVAYDHGPEPDHDEHSLASRCYWPMIETALRQPWLNVFADRSAWLAEPIYGMAKRNGKDRCGAAFRRMLERGALSARCAVAFFLPPFDVCARPFVDRLKEEYLDDAAQLRTVYEGYLSYVSGNTYCGSNTSVLYPPHCTDLPWVVVDWSRHNPYAILTMLDAVRSPMNQGPGIGMCRRQSTLLVLERERGGPVYPGVRWHRDSWEARLALQLEEAGMRESDLYWVYDEQPDRRPTPMDFVEKVGFERVVALGVRAGQWASRAAGRTVMVLEHPAVWGHLHAGQEYPLADLLRPPAGETP